MEWKRSGRYGGSLSGWPFDQGNQLGFVYVSGDGPESFVFGGDRVRLRAPDAAASEDRPLAVEARENFGGERVSSEARSKDADAYFRGFAGFDRGRRPRNQISTCLIKIAEVSAHYSDSSSLALKRKLPRPGYQYDTLDSAFRPLAACCRWPKAPPNPTIRESAAEAPDSKGRIGNRSSESLSSGLRGRSSCRGCSETEP